MKEFKNYCKHGFAYNTYVVGNDKLFPNSKDEINNKSDDELTEETRIVAKFNITSTSSSTKLMFNYYKSISEIEIDGVIQSDDIDYYKFDTIGEHTVKYTLADPTTFKCVFTDCKNLISVIIPSSVTNIDNNTFDGCSNLSSITSLATTAPTITSSTFKDVGQNGTLYVPEGSTVTGYGNWMRTDDYYLGKYNWSIVEQ